MITRDRVALTLAVTLAPAPSARRLAGVGRRVVRVQQLCALIAVQRRDRSVRSGRVGRRALPEWLSERLGSCDGRLGVSCNRWYGQWAYGPRVAYRESVRRPVAHRRPRAGARAGGPRAWPVESYTGSGMAYDSGIDTGLYIVCGLLAMALMAMHGCNIGDDAESEEDSAPEGMFS